MQQLKINSLRGCPQLIINLLISIADFNANGTGLQTISAYENYVKHYCSLYPKGILDYRTNRYGETLEIYGDDELLLSITMCEVNELVMNQNY